MSQLFPQTGLEGIIAFAKSGRAFLPVKALATYALSCCQARPLRFSVLRFV